VVFNATDYQQDFPQHTVYLVNYRGYDKSTGKPSEQALYEDALLIYDHIKPHHQHISVIGRSLGSGVATFLATQRTITRMILVTPYDSVLSVAQAHYPMYPIHWMLHDSFDSLSRAPQIKTPSLIILAEHDSVIPKIHSIRLIKAFSENSPSLITIANSNHDNLIHRASYHTALQQFVSTP
jgi:pimeloyl-ACP methyl ester carboxylesterase